MRLRLVTSFLVLVVLALTLFTIPVAASSAELLRTTLEQTAEREARLFAPLVLRRDAAAAASIADRTRDFQQATGSTVRLVYPGDDAPDAQVAAAMAGASAPPRWGTSAQLAEGGPAVPGESAVSVVLPVREGGRVVAVVRVVAPADEVEDRIRGIWAFRLLVGLGVLLLSAVVAVVLAGSLVRPLRRLVDVASRHGQGDYGARALEAGPRELLVLTRTLNESAARTEHLLAAQRDFVADASHQLRTPLTAMRLWLDNLRDAVPEREGEVERVDAEVRRLGRLVDDLLRLARVEARAERPAVADLAALVEDRVSAWAAASADAGVRCRVDVPRPTPVLVSPGSVEQVLDNVLQNALAVAPRGSDVDLRAREAPGGAAVRLTVRDHGPGMSAEQRSRAFERFWRAGPPGGGSGLGLAVVRRLVEHDHGAVSLQEAPGGGLTVVVDLPVPGRRPGGGVGP